MMEQQALHGELLSSTSSPIELTIPDFCFIVSDLNIILSLPHCWNNSLSIQKCCSIIADNGIVYEK